METIFLKHSIDGRLRLKLSSLKSSPSIAQDVQKTLYAHRAVTESKANHITGSVVIKYNSKMASEETFLQLLKEKGFYTGSPQQNNSKATTDSENGIAKIVFTKAVEVAAERAILALL